MATRRRSFVSDERPLIPIPSSPRTPPVPRSPQIFQDDRYKLSPTIAYSPRLDATWYGRLEKRRREFVRKLRAGRVGPIVTVVATIGGLWLLVSLALNGGTSATPEPCYAFAAPGRLLVNLTHPLYTHWRPLDEEACPPLPHYLPALWQLSRPPNTPVPTYPLSSYSEEYQYIHAEPVPSHYHASSSDNTTQPDAVAFLRKRRNHIPTVLILGDSVDRNGLTFFCELLKQNLTISLYDDINAHPPDPVAWDLTNAGHGPKFHGWDQRGLPHLCEVPFYSAKGTRKVAMRVVNGFHYGMDALDEFDTPDHNDWHKPGRIEVRIDELVVPMLKQMGARDNVDLIMLHSGMWDLALFGLQDDKTQWSLTVPLTPEQLAWWQERMRRTIYHIRQTFPKARLVLRKLHRTDDAVAGTQYITNHYGKVFEGYQVFQEKVHPLAVPGGVLYAQGLMHQLRLALLNK
ncbi:hypothetical protein MNV49_001460 [Pseudohyphozyma bogoriensis]|nr:hypothetical protein MNV49_001460 [Pseudohyphozyma bogoriensis]